MRTLVLGALLMLLGGGCAPRAHYLTTAEPYQTLNGGVAGVEFRLEPRTGRCYLLLGTKIGQTGTINLPQQWCLDLQNGITATATTPKPAPQQAPQGPSPANP